MGGDGAAVGTPTADDDDIGGITTEGAAADVTVTKSGCAT